MESAIGEPAQDAEHAKAGVVVSRADFFDTFSTEVHFGHHENCTDPTCGRCGESTTGPPLGGELRAGDVRLDEGRPPEDARDRTFNNMKIAAGNPDDMVEGVDEETHPVCDSPDCRRCNQIGEAILQPGFAIEKGGSSSGRIKKQPRPLAGPERIERRTRGSSSMYDEGHSLGGRVGRPRDGIEVKKTFSYRAEKTVVAEIKRAGTSAGEIVEVFAEAILMAKGNVERELITAKLMELVERGSEKNVA